MSVDKPEMHQRTAPNHSKRHSQVRFIVMHDTVGTYPGDLDWLTSVASGVSADFYIRRSGETWQLNPNLAESKTWHAGVSSYQGFSNLNEYAIGIEQEHNGDDDDWPDEQVTAAANLAAWLVDTFSLDLSTHPIVSHAQIALPPGRKRDPRNYRWDFFSQRVREVLGADETAARLVWGASAVPINVAISFVDGSGFTNAVALSSATGLSVLTPVGQDGMVGIRPFFESHGFRVEWDAEQHEIQIFPQDALDG